MIWVYFVFIVMDNVVSLKLKSSVLFHTFSFGYFLLLFQDLSVGDRIDISQTISFQLQDPYEQFLHFSAPIFLRSLNLLLTARLRVNSDRIRNVTLTKENGSLIAFFLNIILSSFYDSKVERSYLFNYTKSSRNPQRMNK